jgi:hypothetical protein
MFAGGHGSSVRDHIRVQPFVYLQERYRGEGAKGGRRGEVRRGKGREEGDRGRIEREERVKESTIKVEEG